MNPILSAYPQLLAKFLSSYGFDTVRDYQIFHGLNPDDDAGPITSRHIFKPRICGHKDNFTGGLRFARYGSYPDGYTIKWGFKKNPSTFPRLSTAGWTMDWEEGIQEAFERWSKVINVSFEYTTNTPNWLIDTGRIDGTNGTLAWAELPPTRDYIGILNQKIDTAERLIFSKKANPPGAYIDLGRTMCHEGGHSLGLGHLPTGSHPGALLNPTYGTTQNPQAYDYNELIRSGGYSAASRPTEPIPPTGDNNDELILVYQGNRTGTLKEFEPIINPQLFKIEWVN